MATQWKRKEATKQFSAKGLALIRTGENKAKITFLGKDKKGNPIVWDNGETSKTFVSDELPSGFVFEPKTEGEYYVCTSYDKSEVFAIGPWDGIFEMRPHDISRDKDTKEPAPFESHFKDKETGQEVTELKFKILWKITEPGEFKGCLVSQILKYQGEYVGVQDDGDGFTMWRGNADSERAIWQPRLEKTFERLHVSDTPIPWPDDGNILPEVWERIENSPEQKFSMKIEKGEVVGFAEAKGKRKIEVDVDDDFEETPKKSQKERIAEITNEKFEESTDVKVDDMFKPVKDVKKPAKRPAKKVETDNEPL